MIFYPITALVNAITSTLVCIVVIAKNPRSQLHRSFSYFAFSVAIWSYFYFLWQISNNADDALLWCRALMAGAIFIPSTFLHFSLTLIGERSRYLKKIIFWYIVSLLFLILDFTPLFVKSIEPRLSFSYWPTAGIAYAPFLAMFGGLVAYAHLLMYRAYKNLSGYRRNQIKYVFLGTIVGFLGGSTNYPLWYNIPVPPVGNILVAVYVFLVFYAIIKFRLMDINIALIRAGIFIFVYALVLGVPFFFGYKYGLWQPATWIMLVLATAGPFIYTYFRRRAENVILKEQHRYQQALMELSKTMGRIRELDKLLRAITLTVVDKVKVSFSGIYLKDEEYKSYQLKHQYPRREFLSESVEVNHPLIKLLEAKKRPVTSEEAGYFKEFNLTNGLFIPCFIEDMLLGFLILGPKSSNQMYTLDDLLVFETLSYSTSLAIENSTFWKEIEDRHRKARLQEMDTYSYSLAHEIDNPMQVILGQAEFMDKTLHNIEMPEDKRQPLLESLKFILECQKRVSGMVKAIRDFGSKTTGEYKPVNIEDVVDSFARLYYPKFKEKTVFFEKTSSLKNPLFVSGVKPELMQVLFILADNSVHAMTGLSEKRASLKLEALNHDWVRIYFTDNGYGIKKDNLEIIFKPFTTTKASTEGTGMGLHTAKKIIEKHKGKIWAESEGAGKGASFIIELPIAKDTGPKEEKEDKGQRLF